jgi:hypothetical protein
MTETAQTYDPIPDLGRLICCAQRQASPLPGLTYNLHRLCTELGVPGLAYSDEAEAAIRKALAASGAQTAGPHGTDTTTGTGENR